MTDDSERGRFIWHELMTPNTGGAREFYSTVIGWKTEPSGPGSPNSIFVGPGGPLAGCTEQAPTAAPTWIPFVTVGDIDDALRTATDLGAGIVVEPTAIEQGGRYAVLTDPQGATIGVYSADDFGPERDPDATEFSWHELATTDFRAALEFYSTLFGWRTIAEHDMGPMGIYLLFGRGDKQIGGMFNKSDAGQGGDPAWLSYIRVHDLAGTVEKSRAARGSVLAEPMEVPGGDWVAQLLDPYGAAFAVHALAADMQAQRADGGVSDHWRAETGSAEGADERETAIENLTEAGSAPRDEARTGAAKTGKPKAAKKQTAKKKTAAAEEVPDTGTSETDRAAKKTAAKKASGKKAAKRVSKKAGKKTAKKKTSKKKPAKKKSTKKKPTKKKASKAAKTSAKKAGKKAAKKTGKKTGKKAAKKAGKKVGKKTGKKTGKKVGKKTGKKAGKKSKTGSRPGKKSGSAARGGKKAGKKTAAKKTRKKAGRR